MSVWARIGSWFKIRNQRDLVMSPPQWGIRWLPAHEAGIALTVDEALHVSTVWACMDALVKTLAPRPWHVYKIEGEVRTLLRNDPLDYLLNTRPNPEMTALALREALQYSAIGFGNGYAEIVRDGANRPTELWPLDPDRVIPWRKEESDEVGQAGEFGYRVAQYSGGYTWVPARRIYHVRGPASMNGASGDNLLVRASRAIAISASAQQFSASYFRNGSILSGVLETDKKISDTKVIDNIRSQWVERYAGPENTGKPLVLPEGLKWKEIAGDPNKSQLLETRKFQVEEIARYFGVPLQMIQVTQGAHGYGSNIEQLGIAFVRETLRPWAERFEQEADFKLISGRAPYRETKIDLSELTLGDLKSQVDATVAAVKGGLLTLNEGRARFGWNHIGSEGDVHFLEGTVKTVDQVITPPEPPAPKQLPAANDPGEGDTGDAAATVARDAAAAIYASAFIRHAKRIEKDMPRDRSLAKLEQECADAAEFVSTAGLKPPNGSLSTFVAYVENGEPAREVAHRMLAHMEATP